MKFPFKKFKRISSDKDTSVLEHEDGHQIKVVHKHISPKMREQIAAMDSKNMADGGYVDQPCQNPNCKSYGSPHPNCQCYGNYASGGQISSFCSSGKSHESGCQYFADGGEVKLDERNQYRESLGLPPVTEEKQALDTGHQIASRNTYRDSLGLPPLPGAIEPAVPSPQMFEPEQPPQQQPDVPQGTQLQQAPPQDPYGLDAYSKSMGQAQSLERQGVKEQAAAGQQLARSEQEAFQQQKQYHQEAIDRFNGNMEHIQSRRDSLLEALGNGTIDPSHYWENKSVPGKISTVIGLVLGGLGNSDLPMKMLQNHIEQDIDAQKQNFSNKFSLLNANRQDFQNELDATNMTRVMKADQIKNMIDMSTAKAKDPQEAARLKLLSAQITEKYAPFAQQTAMRKAMIQGAGGGATNNIDQTLSFLRMTNPAAAKSLEERYIPDVGVASIPVPNDVREKIVAAKNLDDQLKKVQAFARKYSGSLDPSIINEGKTMMGLLQNGFRTAEKLGAFKESESGFIESLTGKDPTAFFSQIRTSPKLKAMIDQNAAQYMGTLKGLGISPMAGGQAQTRQFTPGPPAYGKR